MEAVTPSREIVDPRTGEVLPATTENAAAMFDAATVLREKLLNVIRQCEQLLLEESERIGKKTLHIEGKTFVVRGGNTITWDLAELRKLLDVGLPIGRWHELVEEVVETKVKTSIANQLVGANEEYKEIIEAARRDIPKEKRVYRS